MSRGRDAAYVLVQCCLYDVALVGADRASSPRQPARENVHRQLGSQLANTQHFARQRTQSSDDHVVRRHDGCDELTVRRK